jgi:hypothetical protein
MNVTRFALILCQLGLEVPAGFSRDIPHCQQVLSLEDITAIFRNKEQK